MLGLDEIVKMQKQGLIVCVPTDKTSGFAIFNREDYIEAMNRNLNHTFKDSDGTIRQRYTKINQDQEAAITNKIFQVLSNAHTAGKISDLEFNSMDPTNCKTARIYGLAKDHKPFENYPELRPIASLSGSPLENIAKFVDYHSRPLVKNISSYLDDTPDFLRCLEDLKTKWANSQKM